MSQQQSIADRYVFTLAAVSRMGENLTSEAVERHIVRNMRQLAQQAIEDGFRIAIELSYQAEQLSKDLKEVQL